MEARRRHCAGLGWGLGWLVVVQARRGEASKQASSRNMRPREGTEPEQNSTRAAEQVRVRNSCKQYTGGTGNMQVGLEAREGSRALTTAGSTLQQCSGAAVQRVQRRRGRDAPTCQATPAATTPLENRLVSRNSSWRGVGPRPGREQGPRRPQPSSPAGGRGRQGTSGAQLCWGQAQRFLHPQDHHHRSSTWMT